MGTSEFVGKYEGSSFVVEKDWRRLAYELRNVKVASSNLNKDYDSVIGFEKNSARFGFKAKTSEVRGFGFEGFILKSPRAKVPRPNPVRNTVCATKISSVQTIIFFTVLDLCKQYSVNTITSDKHAKNMPTENGARKYSPR